MRNPKRVVETLLNEKMSLAERAEIFDDYLLSHRELAKRMRTGSAFGQQLAVATLFKTLPAGQLDAERKLKDVLGEINSYIVDANARNARKKRDVAKNMQSLPQGAPIIIQNENR